MRVNHLQRLGKYWDEMSKTYQLSHPEFLETSMHPSWGLWHVPEQTLGLVKSALIPGCTLLELGCGQGHDAVGFAQIGANVIGVDVSIEQLHHSIAHPRVKYMRLAAEAIPLADCSIDIITSDHGAFDHSPPELLLKEAYRLLKPGGLLVICTYSPLAFVCLDRTRARMGEVLLNPYPTGLVRFDGLITSSEQSYQTWITHFVQQGFVVERLEEMMVPAGSQAFFDELVQVDWASRWPTDIAWAVRKPPVA